MANGIEWIIDASGCLSHTLSDLSILQSLTTLIIQEQQLHPMADPLWKVFAHTHGVTGLILLAESHLTIHTFPEYGTAAFNLYCCVPRPRWNWEEQLAKILGAKTVTVRSMERPGLVR